MNSNFIVLTTNRSGSVWVMSTLNSLPEITAQGELFLPRKRKVEKRWDSEFAIPRYIERSKNGFKPRPFSVFTYLDDLYRTPGTVGFKLMYKQLGLYPEILIYIFQKKTKVVHLVRKNHLDVLLSFELKRKIGQAHLLAGQSAPDEIQVSLDTKNLIKNMEKLQRKQNLARQLLAWFRLPNIEITYEELLRDQANFNIILNFLSVDPDDNIPTSTLVKIRKGKHRQVISNYYEVQKVLERTSFSNLLDESIP